MVSKTVNSVWEAIVWGTQLRQTCCCNKPTSCVSFLLCRFAIEHCLNCYGRKIEGGDSDTGKLLVCSLVPRPCLVPMLTCVTLGMRLDLNGVSE